MDSQKGQTKHETYLQIYCNKQQTDWASWVPIAQYTINATLSHTTKIAPYEVLIGCILSAKITIWSKLLIPRREKLESLHKKAHDAILHS